jgi:hypothetical protein
MGGNPVLRLTALQFPLRGEVFGRNFQTNSDCSGNVCLDKVKGRYYPDNTGLNPISLFNRRVLEQRTGTHPLVGLKLLPLT